MSSDQSSAAPKLDSPAQSFSGFSPSSFEFKPEVSEFIPSSATLEPLPPSQSPTRSYNKRKGSNAKRSPNFHPRPEPHSDTQVPDLFANFPALTQSPIRTVPQGLWEDTSRLKFRPESEDFIPTGAFTEFIPASVDLNVAASEFIPSVTAPEFVLSFGDTTAAPITPEKPHTPLLVSRPEAESKSPEPTEPQKLPPTDAAETGSSDNEPQKLDFQLIPDSSIHTKVYPPELIHRVGSEDRTRVVTLERVRLLMARTITESMELRKQFMRGGRTPQRPEGVQTGGMARAQDALISPAAAASPWRMERTMEQVSHYVETTGGGG